MGAINSKIVMQFSAFSYSVVWILLAIKPVWRPQWLLENYIVFAFWIFLLLSYRYFKLSYLSYILIYIYLTFHAVGSHYGYVSVPFGFWLSEFFHSTRANSYDRLVHFLYGFILCYPIYDILKRYSTLTNNWLIYLPAEFILTFSAYYELIEAITAWVLPVTEYDAFIGFQGDIWDGYKDMFLAYSGALIISIFIFIFNKFKIKRTSTTQS